jgi:hypothetical protein
MACESLRPVVYESLLPEFVHEKIHSRPCGAYHIRQNLVTYIRDLHNRRASLVQMRQPQEHACEPLLRGSSQQLCHMVAVVFDAGQQIGHQGIRRFIRFAEHWSIFSFSIVRIELALNATAEHIRRG